jgi:hypothetical protein
VGRSVGPGEVGPGHVGRRDAAFRLAFAIAAVATRARHGRSRDLDPLVAHHGGDVGAGGAHAVDVDPPPALDLLGRGRRGGVEEEGRKE